MARGGLDDAHERVAGAAFSPELLGPATCVALAREVDSVVGMHVLQSSQPRSAATAAPLLLGVAVSAAPFSQHFMRYMMGGAAPVIAVHILPPPPAAAAAAAAVAAADDGVQSFVVNRAAQRLLPGLTVRPPSRDGRAGVAVVHNGLIVQPHDPS